MANPGTEAAPPSSSELTTNKPAHMTNFRWLIIGLAFFITLVNYLDRSAISYAITPLKKEFGITDGDFGEITAAFGVGYMLMTLLGGILVDKLGTRKVWSVAAFLWSACTASLGLANGIATLSILRTALGVTEGPHFPALTRVVADWLPAKERARATALGLAAVPLSSVIGAPLITNLIASLGWRAMFGLLGLLGTVWAVVWYFVFRDFPENCQRVSNEELAHIREGQTTNRERTAAEIRSHGLHKQTTTWRYLLTEPSLLINNYAFFAFGYLLFFSINWLPGYLEQTYALQIKQVGWLLIAPWLTAGILLPCAGTLSDWLWNKTGSKRIARSHLIWICQLASAISMIPLMFKETPLPLAIASMSLGVGFGLMPNAAFYALNCDLARDRAATSQGLMNCSSALASILAPLITGKIAEMTGSFSAAFGLLIFFTLTSVISVIFFHKPDEQRSAA